MKAKAIEFIVVIGVLSGFMYLANHLSESDHLINKVPQYRSGDDLSNLNLDQEEFWQTRKPDTSVFWIGIIYTKEDHSKVSGSLQVNVDLLGAYEIYWNSHLIGTNGKFSRDPAGEDPGSVYGTFHIPSELIHPSGNMLALRVSAHRGAFKEHNTKISVGDRELVSRSTLINSIVIHFLAGVFFVVGIYYSFLYFISYQKLAFILFAALCFISFLLILIGFSKFYAPLPYHIFVYRYWIFRLLSFGVAIGTPVFLGFYFDIPYKKKFFTWLLLFSVMSWLLPTQFAWVAIAVGFAAQFGITIWAVNRQKTGSIEILIGQLTFLMGFIYFNITIYLGFSILVIAILFSLSLTYRDERKKHDETLLRSARLELELLKKKIQPHFLMNTLTTIISLIESNPKASVELIDALSKEFHALGRVSDKKLISIDEEIELCRSYMKVMAIRNDVRYSLETNIQNNSFVVPPAIFHTLIENGITHNTPIGGEMKFQLNIEEEKSRYLLSLISFGDVTAGSVDSIIDGTGLLYVKTRLEESCPGRWDISFKSDNQHWQTTITIEK